MSRPHLNKEMIQYLVVEKLARKLNMMLRGEILYRTADGRVLDFLDHIETKPTKKIRIVRK